MRIGVDLDNTLVCYDEVFWKLATEREWIAPDVPRSKELVRDELRRLGRESDWTLLQGEVYGPRMNEATPFPNAWEALRTFRERGWSVFVVSHRTRVPFAGPSFDLHAAARDWLAWHGFLEEPKTGLCQGGVHLETTKQEKMARIGSLKLNWFIDDLPELLLEPDFPASVRKMLFDPHCHRPPLSEPIVMVHHWREVSDLISREGC